MEKLSDVFSFALSEFYKPASRASLSGAGMCCAIARMYRRRFITHLQYVGARNHINDLFKEMQSTLRLADDQMFAYLFEPLESFEGYDVNDLQYLVWQAMVDKLRSEGK